MIVALVALSYGMTIGDITPPYSPNPHNKVGYWSFAGSSMILKDQIILVPPIQYKKGCMWTNCELPNSKYSVQIDMQFYEGNGGSNIAIWFIDRYAADGDFFGGPKAYKGLAVFIKVEGIDDGNRSLKFYIRESNGEELPQGSLDQPDGILYFNPKEITPIDLEFEGQAITIRSNGDGTDDLLFVCHKDFKVNLKEAYLGVTAMNNELSMRVDVVGVMFDLPGVNEGKETVMNDIGRKVKFDAKSFSGRSQQTGEFRNPHIKKIRELSKDIKLGNLNKEATASEVIEIIDELTAASYDSVSYAELSEFVTNHLLPYASKWHRRTLKIVDDARRARDVIGSAWNYTAILLDGFNDTLRETLSKTATQVVSLGELVRPDDIAIELDGGGIEDIFVYVIMAEFLVLLTTVATKGRQMRN